MLLCLALSACGSPSAQQSARPATTTRAAAPTALSVGTAVVSLDTLPLWVAQAKGLFSKHGLRVSMVDITKGGPTLAAAMASGKVPLGILGASPAAVAIAHGVSLRLVASLTNGLANDFIVSPTIKSPNDLKGKKCGAGGVDSTGYMAVRIALKRMHLPPNSVTILQVGVQSAQLAALKSGGIECAPLSLGVNQKAIAAGFRSLLPLYKLKIPFANTSVAAYEPWAVTHKAAVVAFLQAIHDALVLIHSKSDESSILSVAASNMHAHPAQLRPVFDELKPQFPYPYPNVSLKGLNTVLHYLRISKKSSAFYDPQFVEAAQVANHG